MHVHIMIVQHSSTHQPSDDFCFFSHLFEERQELQQELERLEQREL